MADNQAAAHILLSAVTATGAGAPLTLGSDNQAFQVMGAVTAGTGAATVVIEVTNDLNWPWITLGTLNLVLGTDAVADGVVMFAGWKHCRARVTAISGTGATVSAMVGV
jgi:hypothetical protein